jgi:hypothetical protein
MVKSQAGEDLVQGGGMKIGRLRKEVGYSGTSDGKSEMTKFFGEPGIASRTRKLLVVVFVLFY